jgi:hypothetical protein
LKINKKNSVRLKILKIIIKLLKKNFKNLKTKNKIKLLFIKKLSFKILFK